MAQVAYGVVAAGLAASVLALLTITPLDRGNLPGVLLVGIGEACLGAVVLRRAGRRLLAKAWAVGSLLVTVGAGGFVAFHLLA
jgi:hypothetical protein